MGLFGYIATSNTHSNTNIGSLQSRGIVDTITSYSYDSTLTLTALDNDELLLRGSTGKHDLSVVTDNGVEVLFGNGTEVGSMDDGCFSLASINLVKGNVESGCNILNGVISFGDDTNTFSNSFSSNWMITSNHDDLDTSTSAFSNSVWDSSSWGINHSHQSDEGEVFQREVDIFSVKGESRWECFFIQVLVAES